MSDSVLLHVAQTPCSEIHRQRSFGSALDAWCSRARPPSAFDSSSLFLRFQIYSKLPPVMFFHVDPAAKFD